MELNTSLELPMNGEKKKQKVKLNLSSYFLLVLTINGLIGKFAFLIDFVFKLKFLLKIF